MPAHRRQDCKFGSSKLGLVAAIPTKQYPLSVTSNDARERDSVWGFGHEPSRNDPREDDHPRQFDERLGHNDLPSYGVGIFDDRVAVSGYDPDSGTVQVLIDTPAPEAREWAESIYRSYRRENWTVALREPDNESSIGGSVVENG